MSADSVAAGIAAQGELELERERRLVGTKVWKARDAGSALFIAECGVKLYEMGMEIFYVIYAFRLNRRCMAVNIT